MLGSNPAFKSLGTPNDGACAFAEAAVIALFEGAIRLGVERSEIAQRHVQALSAIRTDRQQLVFFDRTRQAQCHAVQTGARKGYKTCQLQ